MPHTTSKKAPSTLLVLPMLALTLLLAGCGGDDKKQEKAAVIRPVKTITVTASAGAIKKTYPAVVLATQQVELSFRVSGKLEKLPIRNNLKVKKGDIIAELDKRDFKTKINQVQSQINQSTAQLNALKAGARPEDIAALNSAVEGAQAQLNQAQAQFNRTKSLADRQLIPRQELDRDLSALIVARANLNSRKQELNKGRSGGRKEDVSAQLAGVQGLRTQLKSLQDALADATLRAPFDGTISSRKVENFTNVQANSPIATIQAESPEVDLIFSLPAPDILLLAPLQDQLTTKVILDSLPEQVFKAERREFSREPDPTTQTYQGRVAIKTPTGIPILPGMTGSLVITGSDGQSGSYSLPLTAITANASGAPFVWVVDAENKVAKREVNIGEASATSVAVSGGVNNGDIVVTAGVSSLQDGMSVKPITAVGE